jgi:hypothetical protein
LADDQALSAGHEALGDCAQDRHACPPAGHCCEYVGAQDEVISTPITVKGFKIKHARCGPTLRDEIGDTGRSSQDALTTGHLNSRVHEGHASGSCDQLATVPQLSATVVESIVDLRLRAKPIANSSATLRYRLCRVLGLYDQTENPIAH